MSRFTYYDFVGVLAPGALLLGGLLLVFGTFDVAGLAEDISLGGFGLAVIVGYVTGQMAQAGGAMLERGYWKAWGGRPSDWLRTGRHELLSPVQRRALEARLRPVLGLDVESPIREMPGQAWRNVVSQMGAAVAAEGRAARLEIFNANYGLMRGVAVVLLVLAVAVIAAGHSSWLSLGLFALVVIAVSRMHVLSVHYARELFVQFLQLPARRSDDAGRPVTPGEM